MLIDEFLAGYDYSEKHETIIRASAENVYRAVNTTDVSRSRIIRGLLSLRGLGYASPKTLTLRDMTRDGFAVLGENPNKEMVLGLAGKFWTLSGCLQDINAENFRRFQSEGYAKAAWNFALTSAAAGEGVRLSTETRVQCFGEKARGSFRFYWRFIRPFSGLIRQEMLGLIKQKAESENPVER
jgi:hypothetical protein